MTTPTPEAIEAAAVAVRKYYSAGGWVQTADVAKLAVEAAAPFIAAQAKGEALREAADALPGLRFSDTGYSDTNGPTRRWLRARAATIETDVTP